MSQGCTRTEWPADSINSLRKHPRIIPCAQCGQPPMVRLTDSGCAWAHWFIECDRCDRHADAPVFASIYHPGGFKEAIEAWNTLNTQ